MPSPNFYKSNLAAAEISSAIGISDTTITITPAEAAIFPTAPFHATIMPPSGTPNMLNSEIVEVSAVNTTTGALTVVRAQRGTTAKSFSVNAVIMVGVYSEDAVFLSTDGTPESASPWITTNDVNNGAITSDKLDWSTVGSIATPATGRNVVKFGNGLMICYGKVTGSIDISTQVTALYSGSSYRSDGLPAITFGATFVGAPSVSVDIHPPANSTASFSVTPWERSGATTTGIAAGAYVITRSGSRTGVAYEYDYIAIGKWK